MDLRVLHYFFGISILAVVLVVFTLPSQNYFHLHKVREFYNENITTISALKTEIEVLQKQLQNEKSRKNANLFKEQTDPFESNNNQPIAFENHDPGKIMFHMHFHKAAGTTICQTAKHNGYKATKSNCNYWKNQTCCGETIAQQKSVAEELIASNSYNFVANEKYRRVL